MKPPDFQSHATDKHMSHGNAHRWQRTRFHWEACLFVLLFPTTRQCESRVQDPRREPEPIENMGSMGTCRCTGLLFMHSFKPIGGGENC